MIFWPDLDRFPYPILPPLSASLLLTPAQLLLCDSILCQVNEDMSGYAVGVGVGQSAAIHHTLQRHTEILQVQCDGTLYILFAWLYTELNFFEISGLQARIQENCFQYCSNSGERGDRSIFL